MANDRPTLVRDLMTVGVPTCPPDAPVVDLTRMMLEKGYEAVVVLDREEGHALGVVSQHELVRAYAYPAPAQETADDVMRAGVPQVPPDIPLEAAAQLMLDQGVRALFLMHHAGGVEYPAAMITYTHFLRHLAAGEEGDLSDLGIHAGRQSPVQAFIQKRDQARGDRMRKATD
jgi:CBS-domain-containing membrane protein